MGIIRRPWWPFLRRWGDLVKTPRLHFYFVQEAPWDFCDDHWAWGPQKYNEWCLLNSIVSSYFGALGWTHTSCMMGTPCWSVTQLLQKQRLLITWALLIQKSEPKSSVTSFAILYKQKLEQSHVIDYIFF